METSKLIIYIAVMAGVTYLVRAIPMLVFKGKIKNQFILSFLHYVPYAVLGAMTFPAVFYSTTGIWSALAGVAVALVLAFFKKNLTVVAICSCLTVFITELLIKQIGG